MDHAGASPFGPMRLIVNPRAGRGAIRSALPKIEDVLRAEGLSYELVTTARPGHAQELARAAVDDKVRFIVAVGGDGTVHEVVNGLMGEDGPLDDEVVLGMIPSGSGADFAKTFGIRPDPVAAARGLAGKTLWGKLDIGRVTYRDADETERARWFVNIAEAGIGAQVVRTAARMPRWLGGSAYRLAALGGIVRFRPAEVSLVMNGRKTRGTRLDTPLSSLSHGGKATMVVIANGQFFGGGLRVAPRAIPSDGMFDVLMGHGTKLQALTALRKMPLGQHVPDETFAEFVADRVTMEGTHPVWIEADGEVLGTTPATFEIARAAIQLKV